VKKTRAWQDWVLLACGAWLLVSLFALRLMPPNNPAAILFAVCGMVLVVSASEAMVVPDPLEEWIDLVAGVALMTGAFLGDPAVAANALIVGAIVTASAFSALRRDLHHHA
jgi:hypothetical protein